MSEAFSLERAAEAYEPTMSDGAHHERSHIHKPLNKSNI